MEEKQQKLIQNGTHETEVQTIPPEFYGGVKKDLPKPVARTSAPSQPLVASARAAPSPASAAPLSTGVFAGADKTPLTKRFSPKMIIAVLSGIFALAIIGIAYYYIHQASVIKQRAQNQAQSALTQIVAPLPEAVTSTQEIAPATSTVPSSSALQPLSGVIFPAKTFALTADSDNDGLTDIEEVLYGTDPEKPDSDNDGYIDGLEVVNLYNPLGFKPVRLIDSGRVNSYVNSTFGYSAYYPNLWTAQSLDATNEQVLFSSGAGDYIEIIKVNNPLKLTLTDWYKGQSPGAQISELKSITTKDKVEGILSPDGLTAYLPFGNTIYTITYNIGLKDQVSFMQTFNMMVQSFRYPGLAEQPIGGVASSTFSTPASASFVPSQVLPGATSTP